MPSNQRLRDLEDLADHLRVLLESVDEGIVGLDQVGNITCVNEAAAAMLGYHVKDLLGKNRHRLIHHSLAEGYPYPEQKCPITQTLHDGRERHVASEMFWDRGGSGFPVAYHAYPVTVENVVCGAVMTFRDLRGEREVEKQENQETTTMHKDFDKLRALITGSSEILLKKLSKDDPLREMIEAVKNKVSETA